MAAPGMNSEMNSGMDSSWTLFFPHGLDMTSSFDAMFSALPYYPDSWVRTFDIIITNK